MEARCWALWSVFLLAFSCRTRRHQGWEIFMLLPHIHEHMVWVHGGSLNPKIADQLTWPLTPSDLYHEHLVFTFQHKCISYIQSVPILRIIHSFAQAMSQNTFLLHTNHGVDNCAVVISIITCYFMTFFNYFNVLSVGRFSKVPHLRLMRAPALLRANLKPPAHSNPHT